LWRARQPASCSQRLPPPENWAGRFRDHAEGKGRFDVRPPVTVLARVPVTPGVKPTTSAIVRAWLERGEVIAVQPIAVVRLGLVDQRGYGRNGDLLFDFGWLQDDGNARGES